MLVILRVFKRCSPSKAWAKVLIICLNQLDGSPINHSTESCRLEIGFCSMIFLFYFINYVHNVLCLLSKAIRQIMRVETKVKLDNTIYEYRSSVYHRTISDRLHNDRQQ